MPWGLNFFGQRNDQNQKKKGGSSKGPKSASNSVNSSSPSTNRVTKHRASSTGNLGKPTKSILKAIDYSSTSAPTAGAQSAPTNSTGSHLFGTDPSNLASFNFQRPAIPQLSPSELAIQQRNQRQAAIAQQKAQEEHDDQLRLASIRRVDPTVTPTSDAFQTILYSFRNHLNSPTSTLNELLQTRFSPDDRELLQPADWERNPALAQLQGRNSEVYEKLVRGEVPGWQKPPGKGSSGSSKDGKKGKGARVEDRGWGKEAHLAFKLTCLYFGLPIAPMGWEQSDTRRWWEKRQQTMKASERGTYGGPGYDEVKDEYGNKVMRPRKNPVQFLNCYGNRVFEKDVIREPDPVLETYNALPPLAPSMRQLNPERDYINSDALRATFPDRLDSDFGLRGGGDFDDEDEEDVVVDEEEHSMDLDEPMELIPSPENAPVSLRGGGLLKDLGEVFKGIDNGKRRLSTEAFHAFAQTENHKEGLKSRLEGERGGVEQLWIPLYGYQGIVWFRIDMLNTFVDAVDRLLGFGIRAGASYKLYMFDRNKEYKTRAQKEAFQRNNRNTIDVACKGPGDFTNDHLAWSWVISHLGSLGNDTNGSPVAHQKVLFVASPRDPVPYDGWEPTDTHNVAKLLLEWDGLPEVNRPDVAYLRMPISGDATEADVHTNEFAPWMAQVCRVLCAGRIPNRPGHPYIPDAYISYEANLGTYGGLTFDFNQWKRILQAYQESRGAPIVLQAYTSESPSGHIDRWHLFVPGVSYEYGQEVALLHSELSDSKVVHAKISNMIETGLGTEQLQDLDCIEVHLPGETFLAEGRAQSDMVIPVDSNGKLDKFAVQRAAELLEQWHKWLIEKPGVKPARNGVDMYPQFITLQPVYREYALVCEEDNEQMLDWNPKETSLDDFRNLIGELWSPGRFSVDYDVETSRVRLSQNQLDGAPMLVVSPTTTEVEWSQIRDMIVWPELVVQVYQDQLDLFGDIFAQPFGYRDIYQTDTIDLFGSLAEQDEIPASTNNLRYGRDYQLWAEDVPWSHGLLRTLMPEDRQPQPASGTTASQQSRTTEQTPGIEEVAIDPNPISFTNNLPPPRSTHTGVFAASRKLDLNAMDPSEKGRFLREFSYANPLTVDFVKGIPVHRPPIDQLLDTKKDSIPRLVNSVLTPSETRYLQEKFSEIQSIILERMVKCQFSGCDAAFPYKDRHTLLARHIKDAHTAEKCNFCGDPLYQHWTVAQRFQHFASKHADILGALATSRLIDPAGANNDHPNPFQFHRELTWGFCCRCGRDHSVLASKLDRFHHDLVCYPGASHHEVHPWRACTVCGERIHVEDAASAKAHKHPEVARGFGTGYKSAFCGQCGLEMRNLDVADREKHAHFCRGHCGGGGGGGKDRNGSSFNVRFCPWCGLEMALSEDGKSVNLVEAQRHIDSCVAKPEDDKRTFGPLHSVSHKAYYYGIPRGAKTSRVDVPPGVIPLKQWLGNAAGVGEKRKPLKARRGEMVGVKGATDLTFTGGTVVPAVKTAAKKAAKKTARFADVLEEVGPEQEEDGDEDMIGSDLSILSSEDEWAAKAAKKAGKRPSGKRKRAPFTSSNPTYQTTWSWDLSDHSSEFMSDDEREEGPSAAKKAKTVAEEPQKPKKPKVSFRPTGKGGKKKLAPFQSEDPSYKPPKDHSDESELSDVAADPLDISLWPEPIEVVKFRGDDIIHESEEDEEEAPAPTLAKKAATKGGATKGTTAAAKPAEPPRPVKTQALIAAAAKAPAKAAAAAQDTVVEKIILKAPPKILPTIHGIREPNSDATTSSSEDEEESHEEPPKKGKDKGKAAAKAAASKKAAGVTTRGKAKQISPHESDEDEDEDEDEEMGEAQSPVSSPTALDPDEEEEEGPPANPPASQAMKVKVKVLRAPDSPNTNSTGTTRSRGLMAKMYQLPFGSGSGSGSGSRFSNTTSSSSPHKTRSRGRSINRPKVSLSPNPRLFGKGTSPDPLQPSALTNTSSRTDSSQTQTHSRTDSSQTTKRIAHISHLRARLHNLQTNLYPRPPQRIDFDHPSVTLAREQRMLRDAYTGADPSAPVHSGSSWAALRKQVDAQEKEDDESWAYAVKRYQQRQRGKMEDLVAEIEYEEEEELKESGERRRLGEGGGREKRKRKGVEETEDMETEFERVQRLQAEAVRSYSKKGSKGKGVVASNTHSGVKVAGFEEDYVDFSEDNLLVDDFEAGGYEGYEDYSEEDYDEAEDEGEEYGEEYVKQTKFIKEQKEAEERLRKQRKGKGKKRRGPLPPPGRVTVEDLEALARSYPGSIG